MNQRYEKERAYYTEYAHQLAEKFRHGQLTQLTSYPQFVVWSYLQREGKPTKPPYDPKTGQLADTTEPSTWGTVRQALDSLSTGRFNGIGFVLSGTDPFVGIDLDDCVGTNRSINKREQGIVDYMNSYTEYSPSGTGLHILTRGDLPTDARKSGNIELYRSKRYLTLTLNHVSGTPMRIEPRLAEQRYLYDKITPQIEPHALTEPLETPMGDDTDLVHELTEGKLKRYWKGDHWLWEGRYRWYPSKSEADFAFCVKLLELTNDDLEQTKRLFRASGMVDQKTDSSRGQQTYLDLTVEKALQFRQREKRWEK